VRELLEVVEVVRPSFQTPRLCPLSHDHFNMGPWPPCGELVVRADDPCNAPVASVRNAVTIV
jgi:hypothetical protein